MAKFSIILPTVAPPGISSDALGANVKIDGREALLRSVEMFLNRDNIVQIQVCFVASAVDEAKQRHGGHFGFSGVKIATGGPRWADQLAAAAEKLSAEATHVLIHDAARPAVPYSDIDALMEEAEKHKLVTLTAPLRAPVLEVDDGGLPVAWHGAGTYLQMLTPQSMTRDRFLELAKAKKEPHASEWSLLPGSSLNVRVGASADATLLKSLITQLPKPKLKVADNPFDEAQW